MSNPSRLLVVGVPRSGTTLLTCMIGWHPKCISMNECFSCQEGKIVSPADFIINKLCSPTQIQFEHPPLNNLIQPYFTLWWKIPVSSWTGLVLKDRPYGRVSISDYVEKRDARLLFILRKPNQVVDSLIRRAELTLPKAASRWAHGIREMSNAYSEYSFRCHIVSFSNLIKNTEQELGKICDFLGLDYKNEMKNGYKSNPKYDREGIDRSVVNKDVPEYKLKTRNPDSYRLHSELKAESH